jgi:hypothetical protein
METFRRLLRGMILARGRTNVGKSGHRCKEGQVWVASTQFHLPEKISFRSLKVDKYRHIRTATQKRCGVDALCHPGPAIGISGLTILTPKVSREVQVSRSKYLGMV